MRARPTGWSAAIGIAAGLVLLSGCAGDTMAEGTSTPADSTPATSVPSPTAADRFQTTTPGPVAPTGTAAELSDARRTAIEQDLAARGVTGPVTIVSVENMQFSDGSLGCPNPGQSYTQALIDGSRVVVEVAGTSYDYRFGTDDAPRLCER